MTVSELRAITVCIDRDWREVYDFASIPENFQRWAAGLGRGFEKSGEAWTAKGPDGRSIRIRFTQPNEFGVLDHIVSVEGSENNNAVRVTPNGTGADITFMLVRAPGTSDAAFAADAAAVERDLRTLKELLER